MAITGDEGAKTAKLAPDRAAHLPANVEPRVVLLVYHRDGACAVTLQEGHAVTVGRLPPSDVVVPDVNLSRQHARFTIEGGQIVVEDLGSTNGTLLRGAPIDRATIRPGDELTLGAVTIAVNTTAQIATFGLAGHDRFCALVEEEIARASFFHRALSVIMVRAVRGEQRHVRAWYPRVQALLRPVDRAGSYSDDAILLALPEATIDQALDLARRIIAPSAASATRLLAGVAGFPESATSADELIARCLAAAQRASIDEPLRVGSRDADPAADAPVAESPAMRATFETAKRVARGIIPVLLVGETGSGKEVLARFLHEVSPRRDEPLVCVNCAAIPAQLVESTLFGHEKGAFTGASQQQKGVFESADGGTVFLDEIGELPPAAQAALLRVLEVKRIVRVGSTKEIAVDVRIVAATHRDLEAMCARGAFREDLLYRLNAVTLRVPPLRERREDIGPLVERFIQHAVRANGGGASAIDPEARALLCAHEWPGNVRELKNAVERAVVLARADAITIDDLPERVRGAAWPPDPALPTVEPAPSGPGALSIAQVEGDFRSRMERLEAALLAHALEQAGWNQTETARRLAMPLRTLVHKIRVHGLRKPGKTDGEGKP